MPKKIIINTDKAPSPIGAYNQAIKAGNLLFLSGQIPIDPKTMQIFKGSIEEETRLVMENIKVILTAAHLKFEHVVKSSIFLSDMANFSQVNSVYGSYFNNENAPAREAVAVKTLPKFVRVEISVIAIFPD